MQSSGEGRTLHGATCAQVCECATRTEREWTRGTSGTGDLSFHLLRPRLLLWNEAESLCSNWNISGKFGGPT